MTTEQLFREMYTQICGKPPTARRLMETLNRDRNRAGDPLLTSNDDKQWIEALMRMEVDATWWGATSLDQLLKYGGGPDAVLDREQMGAAVFLSLGMACGYAYQRNGSEEVACFRFVHNASRHWARYVESAHLLHFFSFVSKSLFGEGLPDEYYVPPTGKETLQSSRKRKRT